VIHRALVPPHRGELIGEWEAARGHIRSLEAADHGLADNPPMSRPGPEYEPQLISLLRDPLVRHGFNTVPSEVAIVDLDTLVVHQQHIDLAFVRHLQRVIGPAPGRDDVFRVCLPYHHPAPPVEWSRAGRDTFVFVSPSNDLRVLGTMSLRPDQIAGHPARGVLAAVVGIAVGFGGNFLNAVRAGNRIILNNGSHRAYALRDLGITRVPCIVQHVSTRDELELVAARAVRADPGHYLEARRPPLFKDYFDPRLRKIVAPGARDGHRGPRDAPRGRYRRFRSSRRTRRRPRSSIRSSVRPFSR
jgi:hypothetical protein